MLDCLKICGNTLEISNQEMSTMVHADSSMISNDCENGTAMILHDDELEEKKLHNSNSHRKAEKVKKLKKQEVKSNYARTAAFIVTSSLYLQLLVAVCIALFAANFVTPQYPYKFYFEAFYSYLFSVGLIFFLYVYTYLLIADVPKTESPRARTYESTVNKKISETDRSHASIFVRILTLCFGLGVMIYCGLEFGLYIETQYATPGSVLLGINPMLQAAFTFVEAHFIFTYSKLVIKKFKFLARVGIMHCSAVNLCVWLRVVGHEIFHINPTHFGGFTIGNGTKIENGTSFEKQLNQDSIMGSIMSSSVPYLYPLIVEYSLLASTFLYTSWSAIGQRYTMVYDDNCLSTVSCQKGSTSSLATHNFSAFNCLGSSKGLFAGFFFLVISVTSLIICNIAHQNSKFSVMASLLSDTTHSLLLLLSIVAILIGFFKTRNLKFQPALYNHAGLTEILLRISSFGLNIYSIFGIISSLVNLHSSTQHILLFINSTMEILQVVLQTIFIKDIICRRMQGKNNGQPGRQLITFLVITNIIFWLKYTFEMQKVESSPIQLAVFGYTWQLILRLTLPLSIFYRLHSGLTLCEVGKDCYKNA